MIMVTESSSYCSNNGLHMNKPQGKYSSTGSASKIFKATSHINFYHFYHFFFIFCQWISFSLHQPVIQGLQKTMGFISSLVQVEMGLHTD